MKSVKKKARRIAALTMSRKAALKSNKKAGAGGPNKIGPNYGRDSNKGGSPSKIW